MSTRRRRMRVLGGGGGVAAPTSLTATPVSTSQIDLAWTDNATNEDGYKIYRSTDNVSFSEIDDIAADSEAYSDTTITAGTTYYYKVAAYNAGGEAESNVDAANTLTLNLISYWELEEESGTRYDAHGTNDLADNNTVTRAAGKIGFAAQFVGANAERLSIASNASLQTGNVSFELDCWYYHDAAPTGTNSLVVGKATSDTGSGYEYAINVNSAGTVVFVVGNVTTVQSVTASTFGNLSAGNWYYLRGFHDSAGTIGVAVNNVENTAARTVTPVASAHPFLIGGFTINRFLNGRVDEVAFWKGRLLTADERASRYNSGNGRGYSYINPL